MINELKDKRNELRRQLKELHDKLDVAEAEYKRLAKKYEKLWKDYDKIDRQLAIYDGRYKVVTKRTHGLISELSSLSSDELQRLIAKLASIGG